MDLSFNDIVKYGILIVLGGLCLYINIRAMSSGVFRSYFEMKHKFKGGSDEQEISKRSNEKEIDGTGKGTGN